jgi:transcriptional regulator with XRE-family HTH domain
VCGRGGFIVRLIRCEPFGDICGPVGEIARWGIVGVLSAWQAIRFRDMEDREPTVRSRELGEGLRRAMECGGFHASGLARELGWSPSRVSRILSGKRGGSSHDVAAFIAICGVRGDERERLMALSVEHGPGWHVHHHPARPRRLRTLVDHEACALAIDTYHGGAIPDLLQTRAYATAVLEANPNTLGWDIEDRVAATLDRQRVFDKEEAPACTFFVHEFVLHTPVGGPAVMCEQLHALLRRSVRPHLSIRVVPRTAGAHAGMAGPFSLLNVRDFKRIVFLDGETASHFIESSVEVNAYRTVLGELSARSLDETRSRELIAKLATKLYGTLDTLPR